VESVHAGGWFLRRSIFYSNFFTAIYFAEIRHTLEQIDTGKNRGFGDDASALVCKHERIR
jgi:hypothetical protein